MVISKIAMVRPTRTNYWLERGYNIEQYKNSIGKIVYDVKTYIEVKVEDLPSGSHSIVEIKCDGCGEILKIAWKTYNCGKRENEEYLCRQCASKERVENGRKTKLSKSKSFEKWCIENNELDVLDRWDYELNEYKPSEISYKTDKSYWFKCPLEKHESELKFVRTYVNGNKGSMRCNKCNSFAQYLINKYGDNAFNLYWSDKNIISPWEIEKCSNKKVWIKCQEKDYHEDYQISPNSFGYNERCPYCSHNNGKIHPKDSLGQYIVYNYGQDFLEKVWSKKNDKSAFEYSIKSIYQVWWICIDNEHEDYLRQILISTACEFRCPICMENRKESILQEKVRKYLESLTYTILHECDCTIVPKNPKTNRNLPFDNEIKELKLVCEVHGTQHYNECTGLWKSINSNLFKRQLYDRYKKIKAINNGYNYLVIPYWTDDKEETWKKLIDAKIKEILNNNFKEAM